MNLKSVLKTINECLDLSNFKKKDKSIRILPKQKDNPPPTTNPISTPSVEHYYQNVVIADNKDNAKLHVIALNKNIFKEEDTITCDPITLENFKDACDSIIKKDLKYSINYNHGCQPSILHNLNDDYEPTIGDRIYADNLEDANQKISMIAIKSNKIIGSKKIPYQNGILSIITSVNELTNDQISQEAYYVWIETNEDSDTCWEKAKKRLTEVK
jgi:hypothetical protein